MSDLTFTDLKGFCLVLLGNTGNNIKKTDDAIKNEDGVIVNCDTIEKPLITLGTDYL